MALRLLKHIVRYKEHLEEDELGAQGGLVDVHEGCQLGQADGGVQLEQLLQAGKVALLLD